MKVEPVNASQVALNLRDFYWSAVLWPLRERFMLGLWDAPLFGPVRIDV